MTPPFSPLFAHSVPGGDRHIWEPLPEHLANVGRLASVLAAPFDASQQALAAGLLHDIGKCSAAYQRYIAGGDASRGPITARQAHGRRLRSMDRKSAG